MKGIIYIRTNEEHLKNKHLTICNNFAKNNGIDVIEVIVDETKGRINLKKFITKHHKNTLNFIITTSIDRITRNLNEYGYYAYTLSKNNIKILYANEV